MARAFALWQDETKCLLNVLLRTRQYGQLEHDCDSGEIDWNVSLSGVQAISDFTYSQCEYTWRLPFDYEADPDDTGPNLRSIRLIVDGKLTQDTDFVKEWQ